MLLMTLAGVVGDSLESGHQRRVLLVEDDFLVGLSIKTILESIGCIVLGPIPTVAKALAALETEHVDAAVLDINIVGGTSVPIAQLLQERHQPFVFVTGYQSPQHLLPELLRNVKRLSKPVNERTLATALRDAME